VNFSQVIVENITVDNLNDIFNVIPGSSHYHPYALTLVLPFDSLVPVVRDVDSDETIQSVKMLIHEGNQFVTFLIPQMEGTRMTVSIYKYGDNDGGTNTININGDRLPLLPKLTFDNIVFHSDIDEYFLFDLHQSLNWGKFSDSDDSSDLNRCAIRGSLLRIDTILQLIVQLWHSYISWTIQSITIHAALVELVGSVLMERLEGIPYREGDESPSWEEDFLNLLYIGRKLHGKFLEVNQIRDHLKSEIEHWELDARRSVYRDRSTTRSATRVDNNIAEDILSLEFQSVANTIHQRLCDLSIDFDVKISDKDSNNYNSSSVDSYSYSPAASNHGSNEIQQQQHQYKYKRHGEKYSKAFDRYCIQDIWNSNLVVIERSVYDFFKAIQMSEYYTYELQDYITNASNILYQFNIQDFRNFDWKRWWTMRDHCESLINEYTSTLLSTVITCAASYMYDVSRDEEEMKGLALSIVGDVKASIENTI